MAITRAQQYRQMLKDGEVAMQGKVKYKDQRLTKAQQKKIKPANQGGGPNYLGKQETVTVPKKWLSSPDHVVAELAYITPREQKILLEADLYGSLKGKPNRGPGGIMSLQGDMGSFGGPSGNNNGGNGGGGQRNSPGHPANNPKNTAPNYGRNDPPSDFRSSNVMNPTTKTAREKFERTGERVKSTVPKGSVSGVGGSGGEKDPDDQVEKDLQDFYNKKAEYPKYVPSFVKILGNINRKPNRDFFVNKVLRAGKIPGVDYDDIYDEDFDLEGAYQDYMGNRMAGKTDAYGNPTEGFSYGDDGGLTGNFINNGGGDNNQTYVPPIIPDDSTDDTEEDATPTRNLGGLAPRFAGSIFDFTGLADGGRAGAMDGGRMMMMANEEEDDPTGGIMDLESGRQMYFLGKLVKKATRAVKKVAKSPVGKAALLYGLGAMGGSYGLTGKLFSKGMLNPMNVKAGLFGANSLMMNKLGMGEMAAKKGLLTKLGLTSGYGSMMPTAMGGILAASTLPLLMGQKEEEDNNDDYYKTNRLNIADIRNNPYNYLSARNQGSMYAADGGLMRTGYAEGSEEPVAKKTMPLLDMDGQEMDLREEGGFVPLGRMERADDVPARLSKNEFVFTADAVRNAGEGDVDKGAEVMYNMMKNLESGGEVSEESQGLDGAREMFKTSQRLEEVI